MTRTPKQFVVLFGQSNNEKYLQEAFQIANGSTPIPSTEQTIR